MYIFAILSASAVALPVSRAMFSSKTLVNLADGQTYWTPGSLQTAVRLSTVANSGLLTAIPLSSNWTRDLQAVYADDVWSSDFLESRSP